MTNRVKKCVENIYLKKEYQYYKEKCRQSPPYYDSLIENINRKYKNITVCNKKDDPAIEIWAVFEKYVSGDFSVEYTTLLQISKIADLFVFQHQFCVDNKDPDRLAPILDGFSSEPYVLAQWDLEKELTIFLENCQLEKIELADMDEVITDLEVPTESIFGKQMTVEMALFKDIYEICEM